MKVTKNWILGTLALLLGVLVLALIVRKTEAFQSANGPQLFCAMQLAKENPSVIRNQKLKNYVTMFDMEEAKKNQDTRTNANWMLKKLNGKLNKNDINILPEMNQYYKTVRGNKKMFECMGAAYAIGKK